MSSRGVLRQTHYRHNSPKHMFNCIYLQLNTYIPYDKRITVIEYIYCLLRIYTETFRPIEL